MKQGFKTGLRNRPSKQTFETDLRNRMLQNAFTKSMSIEFKLLLHFDNVRARA